MPDKVSKWVILKYHLKKYNTNTQFLNKFNFIAIYFFVRYIFFSQLAQFIKEHTQEFKHCEPSDRFRLAMEKYKQLGDEEKTKYAAYHSKVRVISFLFCSLSFFIVVVIFKKIHIQYHIFFSPYFFLKLVNEFMEKEKQFKKNLPPNRLEDYYFYKKGKKTYEKYKKSNSDKKVE